MNDVRDLFLGKSHGTIPAGVTTNKNISCKIWQCRKIGQGQFKFNIRTKYNKLKGQPGL